MSHRSYANIARSYASRPLRRSNLALFFFILSMLLDQSPSRAQNAAHQTLHYDIEIHFVTGSKRHPVQYEFDRGVILFRAQVNGHDVWAMLDNESGDSLIDVAFARASGLTLGQPIGPARTPTGTLERRRVQDVEVAIPGQATFRAPLSAVDLSFASKFAGKPISLVIGREYFESLGFLIDPSSKHFQFGPSGSLTVPPTIPYADLLNDQPQVAVTVNGHPAVVTVDLGFNGSVALSDAAWTRLDLGELPSTSMKSAHFDGLIRDVRSAKVKEVSVGPATLHDVDVSLEQSLPEDRDGIIGLGFFSKFTFSIDEKSGRIWFISGV